MRKKYPSDISREQFDTILELLENVRTKTKPRTVDLYDVFCAVVYVLKTGCQWRALPSDYPNPSNVFAYFQKWSEEKIINKKKQPSILDEVLKKIGGRSPNQRWA